ncbi:hypothetical protein [Psychrobacter sp. I-STPA10]|uniref:hypothetical protein n=1 Tax=Psychrobacter sp. I-STPA10 TaxID=2585769 RepID=UPI001E36A275|nr:hypothetical protein [Psychrobacter sp. I-STPA10]
MKSLNFPLFSMMYSIASTVIIGVLMIVALVIGYDDIPDIIMVAVVGAVIALPVGFVATKKVGSIGNNKSE